MKKSRLLSALPGLLTLALLAGNAGSGFAQDFKAILANAERPENEKALAVKEVTAARFILAKESDLLRNPGDPRTDSVMKDRGKSDRFVLRFEKPK